MAVQCSSGARHLWPTQIATWSKVLSQSHAVHVPCIYQHAASQDYHSHHTPSLRQVKKITFGSIPTTCPNLKPLRNQAIGAFLGWEKSIKVLHLFPHFPPFGVIGDCGQWQFKSHMHCFSQSRRWPHGSECSQDRPTILPWSHSLMEIGLIQTK